MTKLPDDTTPEAMDDLLRARASQRDLAHDSSPEPDAPAEPREVTAELVAERAEQAWHAERRAEALAAAHAPQPPPKATALPGGAYAPTFSPPSMDDQIREMARDLQRGTLG